MGLQGCGFHRSLNTGMTFNDWVDQAMMLAYRWAGYALLNWADDAAIMALMFC